MYLIDLPGYGFATASKTERKKWENIMNNFLTTRDFTVLRYIKI